MNTKHILLERFLTYTRFDTQSKPSAKVSPSSSGQLKLAHYLQQELQALGLTDIELSHRGILTALFPSNCGSTLTIGLLAHLDTSPECSGKNVQAEVIEQYRGGDIALGVGDEFISPVHFPFLQQLVGKTLIVTDGTTLLGADNKAGIAEILTALQCLKDSGKPHCNVRVAFTPDEEIGLGMNFFPMDKFPCDWAYTIDGGEVGELEYENFNAASAKVKIYGRNIHTGSAKNQMINALSLACDYHQGIPKDDVPEQSEGKQGFFHLLNLQGKVDYAEIDYLIRDFDREQFEQRKAFLHQWTAEFNREHNLKEPVEISIEDSYYNMYERVQQVPQAITLADRAMRECGVTPLHKAIRGGTDGAWLAQNGLACPNIFTGGYNFHSKHELITLEGMQSAVQVIVAMLQMAVE
ncbi:MAG: peptidase T [Pasteurellaceae bacterium]|nr:peptidase T [Pasteurellaceae bacterium]